MKKEPETVLETLRELAAKRGGRCLAVEFRGYRESLPWRCSKNHEWTAPPQNIRSGHWCPRCGRETMAHKKRQRGFQDLRKIVATKGGEILSPEEDYLGTVRKLRFRCIKGHEWETRPSVVKEGHWCPVCNRKGRQRTDISALREIAAKRGGMLISATNMGFKVKHRWRCAKGHEWEALPWAVKKGNWCPRCARRGRPPGSANRRKDLSSYPVLTPLDISPKISSL
jgi:hypothetical protein